MERLIKIQQGLKSPKTETSQFGGYQFRKASDILQRAKPLLAATKTAVLLTDDVCVFECKIFLKSTATLYADSGEKIAESYGFAQLDAHKGMSAEQSVGCASSYARKYALCGLFAVDDSSQDPDALPPVDKEKIVKNYLLKNEKAFNYYTKGSLTLDDLDCLAIFDELLKNKKITL